MAPKYSRPSSFTRCGTTLDRRCSDFPMGRVRAISQARLSRRILTSQPRFKDRLPALNSSPNCQDHARRDHQSSRQKRASARQPVRRPTRSGSNHVGMKVDMVGHKVMVRQLLSGLDQASESIRLTTAGGNSGKRQTEAR